MDFSTPLLRTFTICNGELQNVHKYPSEDIQALMMGFYLQMIDDLIKDDEKKVLTWKGYLYIKGDDEYSYYRCSTFVMTDQNLYIATGNLSQDMVLKSSLLDCRDYCLFNEDYEVFPSFVLNFSDAVEFLYDKGDKIEQELQKELKNKGIELA